MPVRLELRATNAVLNRAAARRGAPIRIGPMALALEPVARRQMMGPSGIVGAATKRAAAKTVQYAKASIDRAPDRVDTGWMRDSIEASFVGSNQYQTRFAVASKAPYAIYQHEGTRNADGSWRIVPRPFLRLALQRLRPSDWSGG